MGLFSKKKRDYKVFPDDFREMTTDEIFIQDLQDTIAGQKLIIKRLTNTMCTDNEYTNYLYNPKWTSDESMYGNSRQSSYKEYSIEITLKCKENLQVTLTADWNNTVVGRWERGPEATFNTHSEANDFVAGLEKAYDSIFSKEALANRNNWHKCCCCCECKCLTKTEKEVLEVWHSKVN